MHGVNTSRYRMIPKIVTHVYLHPLQLAQIHVNRTPVEKMEAARSWELRLSASVRMVLQVNSAKSVSSQSLYFP